MKRFVREFGEYAIARTERDAGVRDRVMDTIWNYEKGIVTELDAMRTIMDAVDVFRGNNLRRV